MPPCSDRIIICWQTEPFQQGKKRQATNVVKSSRKCVWQQDASLPPGWPLPNPPTACKHGMPVFSPRDIWMAPKLNLRRSFRHETQPSLLQNSVFPLDGNLTKEEVHGLQRNKFCGSSVYWQGGNREETADVCLGLPHPQGLKVRGIRNRKIVFLFVMLLHKKNPPLFPDPSQ